MLNRVLIYKNHILSQCLDNKSRAQALKGAAAATAHENGRREDRTQRTTCARPAFSTEVGLLIGRNRGGEAKLLKLEAHRLCHRLPRRCHRRRAHGVALYCNPVRLLTRNRLDDLDNGHRHVVKGVHLHSASEMADGSR